MAKRRPLIDEDGEVRELTSDDFKHFRPVYEVLTPSLMSKLTLQRAARSAGTKQRATIPLSPDVLNRFRATGKGWQARIDAALREWLDTHLPE